MKPRLFLVLFVFAAFGIGVHAEPENSVDQLCEATLNGNITEVRALIESGVEVNGRCGN